MQHYINMLPLSSRHFVLIRLPVEMFFFLVSVALLASAHAAANSQPRFPNGRIIGGEDAAIETYPYQVSLQLYGSHGCGGAIISANYVLTAGHCVGFSAEYMTVRAGSAVNGQGGSVHQVEKIVRHEKYYVNKYGVPVNDVAVLRLKEPIVFDETRQPINLYDKTEYANAGEVSVITGWGNTGKGSPVQLQTVSVPIIDNKLCHEAYLKSHGGLPEGQICAAYYGVGGKDACQGDSGGPLAIDGRLAGIVSWGSGCAEAYYPGVYTEVAYFRDWINENAEL